MPVKYLFASLSVLFFVLVGCSSSSTDVATPASSPITTTEAVDEVEAAAGDETAEADSEDGAETEEGESSAEEDEDETIGIEQKNVRLVVENQTTAGQIIIKEVATSRDGWVSIHKAQENGGIVLPESIGEARVDSGDSKEIIVDLWEAPAVGEKLWVLLHIDNGERGTYEFPEKDQAVRKNGETMARSFIIEDPNPNDNDE
ncbi:MAG: hypothetical protein AAGL08_05875 [Cyanobacteria bacterium J06573_11]